MSVLLLLPALTSPAAADNITLLADGDTAAWEYQRFDDIAETDYRVETDPQLKRRVLVAHSDRGASGYIMQRRLDLQKTPWLHFLWKVDAIGKNAAEKEKSGDDFAWRIYFVDKSGLQYRSLIFVYAQNAAAGETWKNPYAGFLRDIHSYALAAGGSRTHWQLSSVPVGRLWREKFNDDGDIGLVGIMSDGDNGGIVARARYGALVLSDQAQPPAALRALLTAANAANANDDDDDAAD